MACLGCCASISALSSPLCRGGMGEALWIRRGTLARIGVLDPQLRNLQTARERLYRGSDLRMLGHSGFLMFYSYLCAKYA